jgi:tRNA(Ile)-lysidine synthase
MASLKKLPSNNLIEHVADKLKQWVKPNQHITIGLSGGIDSVVLLDILSKLTSSFPFKLSAVYCNHQISPNSHTWENFCEKLCAQYSVKFQAFKLNLITGHHGLEAAARQARYAVFTAIETDFLALAHHRDDQAETLLLRLLRGAGVKGLSAMAESRPLNQGKSKTVLIRPLIDLSRENLESYAQQNQLNWIEDESNSNIDYRRNFLRHRIFPEIKKYFPFYNATLARASKHFSHSAALLDELAQIDAERLVIDQKLQLNELLKLSSLRAKNLIRYFFDQRGILMPSERRLDEICAQLLHAQPDAEVCIQHSGFLLRRFKGELYIAPAIQTDQKLSIQWSGERDLALPGNLGHLHFSKQPKGEISLKSIEGGIITIRFREGGEKFQPDCKRPRRTLKNLLQEANITPWERVRLPLVFCNEQLIFVPKIGVACEFQNKTDEIGLTLEWQKTR